MAEQRKGTQKASDSSTEKTVHDLTKQDDLTRVLDRSLRALQEMEQRLQALEQELGSIGLRPGQMPSRLQPHSGTGEQYIGAPNPHGLHGMPMDPLMNPFLQRPPQQSGWMQGLGAQRGVGTSPQGPHQSIPPMGGIPGISSAPGVPGVPGVPPIAGMHPSQGIGFPLGTQGHPMSAFGNPLMNPFYAGAAGAATGNQMSGANAPGIGPGAGGEVSEAMQVGQSELLQGEGTSTSEFAKMTPQVRQAPMDVVDCSNEFLINWELPGVKKENLDIMVTDRSIILNAKAFPELDDGIVVHSERPPVVYRRTVPFQTDVDTTKAKANFKDGVLTVHVPKQTPSNGPKRLDVAYG